jgi:hypothetical protein
LWRYWEGCQHCDTCAGRQDTWILSPMQNYNISAPFEKMAMDITEPYSKARREIHTSWLPWTTS